jgi:hypothetical protein
MCCDQLVCAHCARPVSEAGCPICRAARNELHPGAGLPLAAVVAVIVALLVLAAAWSKIIAG